MAPVNQGYSNAAQKLKQQVVNTIYTMKVNNLSSFQRRTENLWKALLKENFVFSFKNTLEMINAYRSLETAYGKWAWKFEGSMQAWEQSAKSVISTESNETVAKRVEEKLVDLREYAQKELYHPLNAEMEQFFNGKQSEILVQWKATFERKLKNLSTQLMSHAAILCKELLKNNKAITAFQEGRKKYVDTIKKEYITNVKEKQESLKRNLETGNLHPEQLQKLLEKDLFTASKIALYIDQHIITQDQKTQINTAIQRSGGQLTEHALKNILIEKILTVDQVEKILKTIKRTDHDLDLKFEGIWSELIGHLHYPTMKEEVCIADAIEEALTTYVQGDNGALIDKLKNIKFKDWGLKLELIIFILKGKKEN